MCEHEESTLVLRQRLFFFFFIILPENAFNVLILFYELYIS